MSLARATSSRYSVVVLLYSSAVFGSLIFGPEMLRTERAALDASIVHARLNILERDLNNLTTFLDGLSTQSALLAGFAFVSFTELPAETSEHVKFLLYVATSITLGSNLFVVCVGQLVTILGPTLALNGPAGSMEKAVAHMRSYRGLIFWMFGLGLAGFFIMIEVLLFIYVTHSWIQGICAFIVAVFIVMTTIYCYRLVKQFKFKRPTLKFVVGQAAAKGMVAEDRGGKKPGETVISADEYLGLKKGNASKAADGSGAVTRL